MMLADTANEALSANHNPTHATRSMTHLTMPNNV